LRPGQFRKSSIEIHLRIETGKVLRIFTNDLTENAQEIADL